MSTLEVARRVAGNAGFSRMAKEEEEPEEEEPEEEELRRIEGTRFESRPLQLFLFQIYMILLLCYLTYPKNQMEVITSPLTPAGSKIVRVMAADKILADFGLRLWRCPQGTSIT